MKKIMFNDKYGLTRAVLEGRKTQTRRIPTDSVFQRCRSLAFCEEGFTPYWEKRFAELLFLNAQYCVGEEVAIAQSYKDAGVSTETVTHNGVTETFYLGDWMPGWNNKMFVKAELMPRHIRITNVRVERLQDISEEDCLKEGIKRKNERYCVENYKGVCFYTNDPILAFRCLIDKTCGKGTWDSNPYVFVYDFECVD